MVVRSCNTSSARPLGIIFVVWLVSSLNRPCCCISAFVTGPPPTTTRSIRFYHSGRGPKNNGNNNNNNGIVPPRSFNGNANWADDDGGHQNSHPVNLFLSMHQGEEELIKLDNNNDQTDNDSSNCSCSCSESLQQELRGGGGASSSNNKVLKGTKSTLATVTSYWSNAFDKAGKAVAAPFRMAGEQVSSIFESKEKKAEREIMAKLETTKIQAVVVPNTTVVPKEVIQLAARRSGLIGNPLRTDRVQEFAASLKRWYQMRGYILHSVTGATLKTESATAEIQVQEPCVSEQPVDITFCKEMVIDEETGNLLTFRQYKERHMKRRSFGHKSISKADVNTTFVQTTGKTKPSRIAHALGLKPGQPFQWDPARWRLISSSGIFARILQTSPKPMRDGSVQLQILATEAPPRHLEYGVSKSLYTGSWEGEVDFQHENLLGGGETLAVMIRRGTKDPEPSVRVSFRDDKFGMPGGYDVEAFRDYIGVPPEMERSETSTSEELEPPSSSENGNGNVKSHDPDKMLDRRGVKFTYRNPISPEKIRFSRASTSVERTATQSGIREAIGCGTLALGPFRRQLPFEARSSFDGSITTGVRVPERSSQVKVEGNTEETSASFQGLTLLPYTCLTVTTTQVLPLLASSVEPQRQPSLALRHSLSASTRNLPRHEQNAMGLSSMVRGGNPNGRISTSVGGSTELRIPLQMNLGIPALQKIQEDASVVLYGDWVSARKHNGSPFFFEKSIGFGVRKVTQGIPLKFDVSYASHGKLKCNFGLGRDFDV